MNNLLRATQKVVANDNPASQPTLAPKPFPQPSTEKNPFLVTNNLDRGYGTLTMESCATYSNDLAVTGGGLALARKSGTGRQRRTANSLFRKILPVSPAFAIFCELRVISQMSKCSRIKNFAASAKKNIKGGVSGVWSHRKAGVLFTRLASRSDSRAVGDSPLVVAQRNVHVDIAEGGFEADHQALPYLRWSCLPPAR